MSNLPDAAPAAGSRAGGASVAKRLLPVAIIALGAVRDSGKSFTPGAILTPEIVVALTGLAVLALIPVLYKRFKGYARRNAQSTLSTGD